jgi:iron complex transport system substrate-binding protein
MVPSRLIRRCLLASLLFLGLWVLPGAARAQAPASAPQWPMTVTDAVGRSVTIPRPPRAILLGSGFNLVALSLLLPDPVAPLVGWPSDLLRLSPALAEAFAARFPRLREVPVLGSGEDATFSLEAALATGADLAILAGWQSDTDAGRRLMDRLAAAGIPSIVIDFNRDPLGRTASSMRLLGRVLGREAQAEEFVRLYDAHLAVIRDRLAAQRGNGPGVLLHAFPGADACCWIAGTSGVGSFLAFAGGRNLGAERFPSTAGGQLHLEYVLAQDPQVYVASGREGGPGFAIGPGVPPEQARRSLAAVLAQPGLSSLSAAHTGRAHGLWNYFNAVPLNVVAVEALARWSRPALFADIDPAATLAEINRRFAAVPFAGSFWISLDPGADACGSCR